MSYTVGYAENYDKALEDGPVTKIGKRGPGVFDDCPEGYPGGWVFSTVGEAAKVARAHIGYGIYELGGTFTTRRGGDGHLCLDNDAKVLRRVDWRVS